MGGERQRGGGGGATANCQDCKLCVCVRARVRARAHVSRTCDGVYLSTQQKKLFPADGMKSPQRTRRHALAQTIFGGQNTQTDTFLKQVYSRNLEMFSRWLKSFCVQNTFIFQ